MVICDNRDSAIRSMEAGKSVVVQDGMILMELSLEVIVIATRIVEAVAFYAYKAIEHGKHVVMVDKEADSIVVPILKHYKMIREVAKWNFCCIFLFLLLLDL